MPQGRYGRFAWRGLLAYVVGLAAEVPFVYQPDYIGPLVKHSRRCRHLLAGRLDRRRQRSTWWPCGAPAPEITPAARWRRHRHPG